MIKVINTDSIYKMKRGEYDRINNYEIYLHFTCNNQILNKQIKSNCLNEVSNIRIVNDMIEHDIFYEHGFMFMTSSNPL